ncbi:putative NBD/HSP70 family sugar kinase [Amycolatopsis cihanbeyliensis]|uniref:Putative NBD/HSP70 family sugar kinase n=2 Tax=Amycolatopsis cihanbeyliensis TaxID=1128664 RepID=A0A542DFM6_AMYCI|nr:putative NBD/HSP70 family sugar kinase [Amycolatopsis cihanbeyliensis]
MTVASDEAVRVGTPAAMRRINQRAVLDLLRRGGPSTRPQVAKETGLSKPTVGQALLGLVEAGLVRTTGRTSSGPGRSAVVYEADPTAGYVLGIDIGRKRIRVAVADLAGEIVARGEQRNTSRSVRGLVRAVGRLTGSTVAEAGVATADVVVRVLGGPGVADEEARCFRHAANLPAFEQPGVLDELTGAVGPDLIIENDANLAAVGERERGAARDADVFACITVGTGVGMGLVVDGQLFRGASGAAGEIGYLPYGQLSDARAGAPPRGHLEEATGAESVVLAARRAGLAGARSARQVFRLARQGDEPALRAVEAVATRLAFVIASVAAVVDPRLVVLSGGIATNADLLRAPMDRALRAFTPLVPRIVQGELGEDAVLAGAIATGLRAGEGIVFDRRLSEPSTSTASGS